jgi:hypothetical protein
LELMAKKVNVVLVDDLDGGDAEETLRFGLDGTSYEIDLSKQHAYLLREGLAQWVAVARRVPNSSHRGKPAQARSGRKRSAEVRDWCRENDIEVNDRGRIPVRIQEQFDDAH